MKNPKTTAFGILTIISIVVNLAMQFMAGEVTGPEIGAAISGITGAIGLITARDAQPAQ